MLKVMVYHGTRKMLINPKEVSKYDVVISTYETVVSEHWPRNKDKPGPVPSEEG